jgi:hypothetical protein
MNLQFSYTTIEEGLDFILGDFEELVWPRTISTKTTEGRQISVFNKDEALDSLG